MKNIFGLALVALLVLASIFIYQQINPRELTYDDCLRLGSNERMSKCLEKFKTPEPEVTYVKPEEILVLNGTTDHAYSGTTANVTIKNNSKNIVNKVGLKFKYYKYGGKCEGNPLDTESYIYEVFMEPGDTKIVEMALQSPISKNNFTFCVDSLGGK